eukprot:1786841-Amphidinium_carterae.1
MWQTALQGQTYTENPSCQKCSELLRRSSKAISDNLYFHSQPPGWSEVEAFAWQGMQLRTLPRNHLRCLPTTEHFTCLLIRHKTKSLHNEFCRGQRLEGGPNFKHTEQLWHSGAQLHASVQVAQDSFASASATKKQPGCMTTIYFVDARKVNPHQ